MQQQPKSLSLRGIYQLYKICFDFFICRRFENLREDLQIATNAYDEYGKLLKKHIENRSISLDYLYYLIYQMYLFFSNRCTENIVHFRERVTEKYNKHFHSIGAAAMRTPYINIRSLINQFLVSLTDDKVNSARQVILPPNYSIVEDETLQQLSLTDHILTRTYIESLLDKYKITDDELDTRLDFKRTQSRQARQARDAKRPRMASREDIQQPIGQPSLSTGELEIQPFKVLLLDSIRCFFKNMKIRLRQLSTNAVYDSLLRLEVTTYETMNRENGDLSCSLNTCQNLVRFILDPIVWNIVKGPSLDIDRDFSYLLSTYEPLFTDPDMCDPSRDRQITEVYSLFIDFINYMCGYYKFTDTANRQAQQQRCVLVERFNSAIQFR